MIRVQYVEIVGIKWAIGYAIAHKQAAALWTLIDALLLLDSLPDLSSK